MSLLDWFGSKNEPAQQSNQHELDQIERITNALSVCSSCMMIADKDRNIVYVNDAVVKLLRDNEAALKKELPHFSADRLVGENIDQFHKNPAHQKRMLAQLTQPIDSSIVIGEVNLKFRATPIMDDNGESKGTIVEWVDQTAINRQNEMMNALDRSQGIIEFSPKGEVLAANQNFLELLGYNEDEIIGMHHRQFVPAKMAQSTEYADFWKKLRAGQFVTGEFHRIAKSGEDVWVQASYNPVVNSAGTVTRVVKYAVDITEDKQKNAYFSGQIAAINQAQAVIEFDSKGNIIHANENFLSTMGYTLSEIKGRHHSMFVSSEDRSSNDYRMFWDSLGNGQFQAGEFKRIGKQGKEVWLQATYNPILDQNGEVFRVVKYATDITGTKAAINDISDVMTYLSSGNLTQRLEGDYIDEFTDLASSINQFIAELSSMIADIRGASETISSASSEIAKGNSDLSTRTEQQASNLEETASSMEELTSTVQHNADNAKQANSLASDAVKVAQNGGSLIEKVVTTMSEINASAKKIEDIIGVIDGIAFQTNILALNAAVEAARAGEQGRGFAVVASEVRTLAQRSANAAKDIKALISDSVNKIESGNSLVNESGDTMREIVSAIQKVNDIMSEIASASVQQASGIDEINRAVTQMDEMTQQNAALVEEAAAASESMNSQATQLIMNVNKFVLDESSERMIAAPVKPAITHTSPTSSKSKKALNGPTKKLPPAAMPDDDDEWESF